MNAADVLHDHRHFFMCCTLTCIDSTIADEEDNLAVSCDTYCCSVRFSLIDIQSPALVVSHVVACRILQVIDAALSVIKKHRTGTEGVLRIPVHCLCWNGFRSLLVSRLTNNCCHRLSVVIVCTIFRRRCPVSGSLAVCVNTNDWSCDV